MIYSYILSYVYYIHIAHKYNIPFSVSNSMSPTCPLVYIHRYTTYHTIYIHMQIFWIFYEHINLRCTHVYIHNYIYLSIYPYVIFFLRSCLQLLPETASTIETPGQVAIWALSWIWLIRKVSCWGNLAGQQRSVGGWLGYSCGLADFFGHGYFFFGV